jgi:hypothetical protein
MTQQVLPQWAKSLEIPGYEHIRRWCLSLGIPVKSSDYDQAIHPIQITNNGEYFDRSAHFDNPRVYDGWIRCSERKW